MPSTERSWQDHDHLQWLSKEAPRYTSYPSAHHFERVSPATYSGWLQSLTPDQSVGLYVHVPFCEQMCWFCGCNTQITRRYDPVEAYVDNLLTEIRLLAGVLGFRPRVHALHFGGGSPGMLTPESLTRLMTALFETFDIRDNAEISIELDPRRVTREKVLAYALLGFNRVSLGVQDTQAQVQAAINRIQPMDQVKKTCDLLRAHDISEIGIDLIYGLPHQTANSLEHTLEDVAKLAPNRISAFSYAHVPWVKKHQRLIDATTLPDTGEKALQYLQIDTQLQAMGYAGVGIDHFARADDGLARAVRDGTLRRNFMGYTDLPNDRLIGLGASSISNLDQGLAQNIAQATSYQSSVTTGVLPTVRGWTYHGDDRVRGEIISQLMCFFRADVGEILTRHGYPFGHLDEEIEALGEYVEAGLVSVDKRVVTFDNPLKMLVRPVACTFDRYARRENGPQRYSRVA
ncbi:oxygen-independent coproporphyrinogen III oxidase [Asticcacaulis biprosthecium C19]|uniref:Coproporphyrinogen-III oxidase n=1 Tax=Asticcacaulis biprosthecium C19 TaxID=715226 RepID=F4QTA6_9CAUL|nr:oxygen-independent coproporphyrinogen III oxidase [Asticcacaulis biprosthecium]EGF89976.1 oxygen-independent coproporphyrinogen III oxidase [Asticcacaulis biprosthecium C19]